MTRVQVGVQGIAWVREYSGNDCTWKVYRTANVMYKERRTKESHHA